MSLKKSLKITALVFVANSAFACNGTWISTVDPAYDTASNWQQDCIPSVAGDTALFPNITPATFSVTVSGSPVISTLVFNAPNTAYTMTGGLMTLANPNPTLNIFAGTQTFANRLNFSNAGTINNLSTLVFTNTSSLGSLDTVTLQGSGLFQNYSIPSFGFSPFGFVIEEGTVENYATMSLSLGGSLVINGGNVTNETGGTLGLTLASVAINGGTITNNGGFSTALAGSQTQFTLNGGLITNKGDMAITADVVMNGGYVSNSSTGVFAGAISAMPTAFSTFAMNGGLFINEGQIGPTTVTINGGILVNDGTVVVPEESTLAINGYGFVRGTGSFSPSTPTTFTFQNSGYLFPGDATTPIATLTINDGAYVQTNNGTLILGVQSDTNYSKLVATSAQLNGTLAIVGVSPLRVTFGESLEIISTLDGVTGKFSNVKGFNLPNLLPYVSYLEDSVQLTFTPTVSSYIGHLYAPLFSLVTDANLFMDSRLDQLKNRRECTCREINFYAGPLGGFGEVYSRGSQLGFDYATYGALIGCDYTFDLFGLGAMIDYQRIEKDGASRFGTLEMDHLHGSIYASYIPLDQLSIIGIVGGSYDWIEMERHSVAGILNEKLKSEPRGSIFDALLGIEYTLPQSDNYLLPYLEGTPFLALQYIHLNIDKYREHAGTFFEFDFASQQVNSLRTILGYKANCTYQWKEYVIRPSINLAWQREYLDDERTIHFSPIDIAGPSSSLTACGLGRDSFLAGINLLFMVNEMLSFEINYEYELNGRYENNLFYLGSSVAF